MMYFSKMPICDDCCKGDVCPYRDSGGKEAGIDGKSPLVASCRAFLPGAASAPPPQPPDGPPAGAGVKKTGQRGRQPRKGGVDEGKPERKKPVFQKECAECQRPFEAAGPRGQYCPECAKAADNRKMMKERTTKFLESEAVDG